MIERSTPHRRQIPEAQVLRAKVRSMTRFTVAVRDTLDLSGEAGAAAELTSMAAKEEASQIRVYRVG